MNWFKKISSLILYHHSDISPDIVLKQGLQKKSLGLTEAGTWAEEEGWIPKGCIYLSKDIESWPGQYVYAVNIEGLSLLPDFPSLVDVKAYVDIDNECLYWKNSSEVPVVLKNNYNEDYGINHQEITGEDSLAITGNVCVQGPIDPSRIRIITK